MRVYEVPPDITEKEKVIGGLLDFVQFAWAIGGLVLGGINFLIFSKIFGMFALFPSLIIASVAIPFMFYKKRGMTLFQYIVKKHKFKKKQKHLINRSL